MNARQVLKVDRKFSLSQRRKSPAKEFCSAIGACSAAQPTSGMFACKLRPVPLLRNKTARNVLVTISGLKVIADLF